MVAVSDYDFQFSIRLDEEGVTELNLPIKYSDLANLIRNRANVISFIYRFANKEPLNESLKSLCFMGVEHEDDDCFEYSKSTSSFEFKGVSN